MDFLPNANQREDVWRKDDEILFLTWKLLLIYCLALSIICNLLKDNVNTYFPFAHELDIRMMMQNLLLCCFFLHASIFIHISRCSWCFSFPKLKFRSDILKWRLDELADIIIGQMENILVCLNTKYQHLFVGLWNWNEVELLCWYSFWRKISTLGKLKVFVLVHVAAPWLELRFW